MARVMQMHQLQSLPKRESYANRFSLLCATQSCLTALITILYRAGIIHLLLICHDVLVFAKKLERASKQMLCGCNRCICIKIIRKKQFVMSNRIKNKWNEIDHRMCCMNSQQIINLRPSMRCTPKRRNIAINIHYHILWHSCL